MYIGFVKCKNLLNTLHKTEPIHCKFDSRNLLDLTSGAGVSLCGPQVTYLRFLIAVAAVCFAQSAEDAAASLVSSSCKYYVLLYYRIVCYLIFPLHIYIYIYREREICRCVYIYIYIYRERERERERERKRYAVFFALGRGRSSRCRENRVIIPLLWIITPPPLISPNNIHFSAGQHPHYQFRLGNDLFPINKPP